MKQFFMSFTAILFPWLVFFIYDNPGAAIVALILQATAVGWIPASIWAWRTCHSETPKKTKSKELEA